MKDVMNLEIDVDEFMVGIYKKIPRHTIIVFIYSIICSLGTHLYMFTNKLLVGDELYNLFSKNDTTTSGRWFLAVLSAIGSEYSMPWVNGIISIVAISIAIGLIISTIGLQRLSSKIVAASLMISFPTVAATLGYMFTADAYFIGLMLASLAIYFVEKYKRGYIGAIGLLTLSLAVYQANFTFAIGIIYVVILLKLIEGKNTIKDILMDIFKYCIILGVSFVTYYLILKIILFLRGDQLTHYQGVDQMLHFTPKGIFYAMGRSYKYFLKSFYWSFPGLNWISIVGNGLLLIAIVFQSFTIIRRGEKEDVGKRLILNSGIIFLMPIGINSIILFVGEMVEIHLLMVYSLVLFFIIALRINEIYCLVEKRMKGFIIGLMTLTICLYSAYNGYIVTNKSYLISDLSFKKTFASANRILSQIEEKEEYSPETQVAIIGNAKFNSYLNSPSFTNITAEGIKGMTGVPITNICTTPDSWYLFIYNFLGASLIKAPDSKISELKQNDLYLEMPTFPKTGSIEVIDDIVVVKLSMLGVPFWSENVIINGEESGYNVNLMKYESQLYMPLRFISRLMDTKVYSEDKTLYLTTDHTTKEEPDTQEKISGSQVIKFEKLTINNNEIDEIIDVKTINHSGNLYIEVDIVESLFEIKINYDNETAKLKINKE